MRKRKRKRQRKIIIVSMISLLCIMTAGYAAFQTNLNITAKGNIVKKELTPQELKEKYCNTQSGDGLYKDTYEEDRCVYKGANPNNYITFNDELWRIISVESDGTLKIMKNESIGNKAFDEPKTRTAPYCNRSEYGCNVWGSSSTMMDALGNNVSAMKRQYNETSTYALPTEESSMAVYLNTAYYNTINEGSKSLIDNHLWNIGLLAKINNQSFAVDLEQERYYKWKGRIGLINSSDYIKASIDENCINVSSANRQPSPCKNNNYMYQTYYWWTMSPSSNHDSDLVWIVYSEGYLDDFCGAYCNNIDVRPTLYLKSNITLLGQGTEDNPYKIVF